MNKLGNLTIILPSYRCDRNCPFCIAKNNRKFNNVETNNFNKLSEQLEELRERGIRFERIVLSGNGEPSLYNLEKLEKYARIIKDKEDLFDALRIHTSGNIFWEKEKFDLFNDLIPNVEFDILRVAISPEKDMKVLGYSKDYTQTEEFKRAKKIQFDIALTKELENSTFPEKLEKLLHDNPNIGIIRLKSLMIGDHEESNQSKWVRDKKMSKNEFVNFARNLLLYYGCVSINDLTSKNGKRIIFENSGNYYKDVVFSDAMIRDYAENPLDINKLQKMALRVDNMRDVNYYEFER